MKKHYDKVAFFIFFIFVIILNFEYKKKFKGTNLKFISKNTFYKKIYEIPNFLLSQIQDDLSSVKEVTQKSLKETFFKIKGNDTNLKKAFYRYRIVDNKLYKYRIEMEDFLKRLDFERAIITLSKLIKLPDIDFIYSDLDGLPLDIFDQGFYETKNQAPIFCHAKLKQAKNLVLIPDHNSFSKSYNILFENILREIKINNNAWSQKIEKAFWRGGSNDQEYTLQNYKEKPRIIISKLSKEDPSLLDAGITNSWFIKLFDVLKKENLLKEFASEKDHLKYKYLPSIDGNMCTYPGLQWRLLSNSVCIKQSSDQIQWYYKGLKSYVHYIPIAKDLSDFWEKISWMQENDKRCFDIANNATLFAKNHLTSEDMYVYLYEVFKKYKILQTFEKKDLLVDLEKDYIRVDFLKKSKNK